MPTYPGQTGFFKRTAGNCFAPASRPTDPITTAETGPVKVFPLYAATEPCEGYDGCMVGPYYMFFRGWWEDKHTLPTVLIAQWVAYRHPAFDPYRLPDYLVSAVNGRSLGSYQLGDYFDTRPPEGKGYLRVSDLKDPFGQDRMRAAKELARKNLVQMIEDSFVEGKPIPRASVARLVTVDPPPC